MTVNDVTLNSLKKISALIALCLPVILLACKDDDDSAKCENGSFAMTLNGVQVEGVSFNNTLVEGTSGKRMDIRATDDEGRQVIISFTDLSGTDGNCVSTGAYTSFDDVTTGTENTFMFTIIENGVSETFTDGEFDLSTCDENARKVSGTFSFSFGDTAVTNGSFEDMCYSIL